MKRKYFIAIYEGGAVYEPAEGGYYIPVLELDSVSREKYSEKHARRILCDYIAELTEIHGEPIRRSRYRATFRTGDYIGEEMEIRITAAPEQHEKIYHGYC